MKPALIGLEESDLQQLLGPEQPRYRARQLYQALYRQRAATLNEITTLPATLREKLATETTLGRLELEQRYDSGDGTRRYLLRLADAVTVECVLMPEPGRNTICVSTQAGCPMDCRFCLTAQLGFERNLTAGEIVGQVLHVIADNALDPAGGRINVVLMGQGEPLLNLPNVLKATRLLTGAEGLGLSEKRITLSTVGIVPKLAELGRAAVRPRLAVSLNASSQQQRAELMPVARNHPLHELLEACRTYPLRPWEKLTFEYVLLAGVNDSDADARHLVRLLAGLRAKVNLIALNPAPEIEFETPAPERVSAFQAILRRSLPCFIRKSRGLDIHAACGQLKRSAAVYSTKDC